MSKVYLVGPSYKWDDDIEIFLSPEDALKYYQNQEDKYNLKGDGTYYDTRVIFHLSEDNRTILDQNNEDRYYIDPKDVKNV